MDSSASLGNVSQTEGDSYRPKSKLTAVTIAEGDENRTGGAASVSPGLFHFCAGFTTGAEGFAPTAI